MSLLKDLTGQIFNRLTVLHRVEKPDDLAPNRKSYWLCRCICGKERIVVAQSLISGSTKSCGCLRFGREGPHKKPYGMAARRSLFITYRHGAINRNLEFTFLDPFFGSGTTAIVCEKLNRKWIGIELNEKYCQEALNRIMKERNKK